MSITPNPIVVPLEVTADTEQVDMDVGGNIVVSNDYNRLTNKPSINGVELVGNKTSEDLGIVTDKHYAHEQMVPSAEWTVTHNLNKYPAVTIVDSAGTEVVGDVQYIDANTVRLSFNAAFSGSAYFN